jgi:hypothetical protein
MPMINIHVHAEQGKRHGHDAVTVTIMDTDMDTNIDMDINRDMYTEK